MIENLQISVKKLRAIVVRSSDQSNREAAGALNFAMNKIGFIMNQELFEAVGSLPLEDIKALANPLLHVLRVEKGADVNYDPMYPNFPDQVFEMSDMRLYLNAVVHYWTGGLWTPSFEKELRAVAVEPVNLITIGLATDADFAGVFTKLLSSKDSLSQTDLRIVDWFLTTQSKLQYPEEIPFKETLCSVAGTLLNQGKDISNLVSNATDVLRIMTKLSGGDVSLAANTKFKSLPRKHRKILTMALEKVASLEDLQRHKEKWVRALHSLHVGDYSKKMFSVAKKLRENKKVMTFEGQVETKIQSLDSSVLGLLKQRPGVFARRIDHLLRRFEPTQVVTNFLEVIDKVPTRNLTQLWGNLKARGVDSQSYIVFPKGQLTKPQRVDTFRKALDPKASSTLQEGIRTTLVARFSSLDELGKVWVDPALEGCPLPSQQRSATNGLVSMARGTRAPLGDAKVIRGFLYWVGRDIDLSVSFHDENFKAIKQLYYGNMRLGNYAVHSGDITNAPKGASEFVDVDIEKTIEKGYRYMVLTAHIYSGPKSFAEHKKCYIGWMGRTEPNSNEIYEPATVSQKMDLVSEANNGTPVIFDLVTREAIWVDLTMAGVARARPNNVVNSKAGIVDVLQSVTTLSNKVNLHELFSAHAEARGTLVEDRADADTVFSWDSEINPTKVMEINSEFLV